MNDNKTVADLLAEAGVVNPITVGLLVGGIFLGKFIIERREARLDRKALARWEDDGGPPKPMSLVDRLLELLERTEEVSDAEIDAYCEQMTDAEIEEVKQESERRWG